jgi:hypothetical protein
VIYTRESVELDRSLLTNWVCASYTLLRPLVDAVQRHVFASAKLHADNTPIPADAGNGSPPSSIVRSLNIPPSLKVIGCGSTVSTILRPDKRRKMTRLFESTNCCEGAAPYRLTRQPRKRYAP